MEETGGVSECDILDHLTSVLVADREQFKLAEFDGDCDSDGLLDGVKGDRNFSIQNEA